MSEDFLSTLLADIQEGWKEGRAQAIRDTTPVSYWCHLYDDFNYSPVEFFRQVGAELEKREVPGLLQGFTLMRESNFLSRKRLYLHVRRERFVFEICAAPFGTGWFVSSRLFDRRRGARWFDFLILAAGLILIGLVSIQAMGLFLALATLGSIVTILWSLMRLAATESVALLDDRLCRIPCLGRIYETLFHPDTFFRQDQRAMYQEAVHRSVMKVISDLTTLKGIRPLTESESKPVMYDLHRR